MQIMISPLSPFSLIQRIFLPAVQYNNSTLKKIREMVFMKKTKLSVSEKVKIGSLVRSGLIRDLYEQNILTDKQFELLLNSVYTAT